MTPFLCIFFQLPNVPNPPILIYQLYNFIFFPIIAMPLSAALLQRLKKRGIGVEGSGKIHLSYYCAMLFSQEQDF